MAEKLVYASEKQCVECRKQAVAFFPVCDPDIPSHPYCRECLDDTKQRLQLALMTGDDKWLDKSVKIKKK